MKKENCYSAHGHCNANNGIEHPDSNGNDNAGRPHDLKKLARRLLLHAPYADFVAKIPGATGNGLPTLARHGQNERAMALNGKNALFAGSDVGAENWAIGASLIESCKLNAIDPQAYLTDTLTKIVNGHPNSRIDELQ
jgi:hypothetical protein